MISGYSPSVTQNHSIEVFLTLLSQHDVTAVADVRSAPYSRFCPQFNRDELTATLRASNIRYSFLGRELGGRSDDPACYEGDRSNMTGCTHERLREGLARVVSGAASYRIALMCAEKEPLDCHRTLLVAPELVTIGVDVVHILASGELEAHERNVGSVAGAAQSESRSVSTARRVAGRCYRASGSAHCLRKKELGHGQQEAFEMMLTTIGLHKKTCAQILRPVTRFTCQKGSRREAQQWVATIRLREAGRLSVVSARDLRYRVCPRAQSCPHPSTT